MAITVDIPQDVEKELREEWPELERRALEAFVVEAYREKKISSYTAGRILGFESRWKTIDFLSERGVYPNYDVEDFNKDMENLAKLENRHEI